MSNFFRNIHPLLRRNKRPEKYDDTNFAVLNALNYELTQAEQETIASKIQSSLESATDTYLDTWGDWFGVYHKDGWDDEYYRARIIRELLLKRGTIPAIIDALVDFLNDNDAVIQIYEPWRNIFYTNKSKLNGDDHLMGYYYRFAIIDISIDRPFPPEIVEIIKAFKPAGVLFYLRLDTSLAKNKTTVESPYVYLDVTNKTELEFLNGLYYDLRGNINLSDQRTQVVGNNIFHTNNSKLNGEDVLAGAFNHGRGYVHLASTTLLDYTPKATDSMSNLKTTLGEAGSDMYNQTKEKDGRTASIQVPATKNVHTLYSNSTDFGDYDYSGNPNLLSKLSYDLLANQNFSVGTLSEGENSFKYTKTSTEADGGVALYYKQRGIANWLPSNKRLVMTVKLRAGVDYSPADGKKILIRYRYVDNGTNQMPLDLHVNSTSLTQEWQEFSVTGTTSTFSPKAYHPWMQFYAQAGILGEIEMSYDIKIEEGSTATPYQPNLLDAPYYLSKAPLGENIANKAIQFPIKSSEYLLYKANMEEEYILGQTYTITLKGKKPASQTFIAYNDGVISFGNLKPVEGLIDVWSLTFTPTKIASNVPKEFRIFQYPSSTVGTCQIDWLKIEKGNTRTPNIDSYDYVGSLIEDTETPTLDPTKYTWTVNGDVTNKKAYMIFDIKTFIEENYATEFEKLVADLGEDQALNTVFENFNISTALKALVSPSSPINFLVELYDFSTSAWHKLNTDSLDLRMRTFNLVANRITDYLNDYKLLFVRYVFDNETDKDVTVELDMLNVLFNYRLGDGYSVGLQSTVECLSEIPLKGLTLSSESVELGIDETSKVTATPVPANATNKSLEWEIADPKIATVDTSGNITGVAIGETTSTVYGEDRTISATCSVSVKARHTLYSNSTDFGAYDYSGNPNLMNNLSFSDFAIQAGGGTISDGGKFLKINKTSGTNLFVMAGYKNSAYYLTPVLPNTTYTITYVLRKSSNFVPQSGKRIILRYRLNQNDTTYNFGELILDSTSLTEEFTTYTKTFTTGTLVNPNRYYFQTLVEEGLSGEIELSYEIKLERGSTATPYQPNLLDAPYYLSKVPLGENIKDKGTVFPIKTSAYAVYSGANTKPYIVGKKYTLTMKATKPSTQTFNVFLDAGRTGVGSMTPVEGLTDVWQKTFTVGQALIDAGVTNRLAIYQVPNSSVGAVQIDWLKIEEGDTRTPNIDSYAYRGTVLTASEESPKDPNAYTWSSI
nr:MAG TPA: Baseplate wedge protein [Herelleviridae sp.]